MDTGNCKHCGAHHGLHHYQTMQCPVGGREASVGQRQEWMTQTFAPEVNKYDELRSALAQKDELIATLVAELTWAWESGTMQFVEPPAAEDAEFDVCRSCGKPEYKHDPKCRAIKHKADVAALLKKLKQ